MYVFICVESPENKILLLHCMYIVCVIIKSCFLFFRGSKDRQELWRAPHLQNFYLEVCQCLHAHCLFGLFQGQVNTDPLLVFCAFLCLNQPSVPRVCLHSVMYIVTMIILYTTCFAHLTACNGCVCRLVGRPGNYLYVVGSYRMEEVIHI